MTERTAEDGFCRSPVAAKEGFRTGIANENVSVVGFYPPAPHTPLERTLSTSSSTSTRSSGGKNVIVMPEVNFPTKKLRMRSLLWMKPTGVAVSSTSSFLAQLCPTIIVNLAALSTGIGLGYSAIALPQLTHPQAHPNTSLAYLPYSVSEEEGSWIAGIFGLGAIFGGFASAFLGARLGRRHCMLLLTVPDVVGWVLIASSQNYPMIMAGRFLTGFASAGYAPSIQVYIAEIAQPQHRGTLSGITIPVIASGTLLAYCLGSVLSWHYVAIFGATIPLILIPGLLMMSNSPYWYLRKGEDKKALRAMERFRSSEANGLSELLAIADSIKSNNRQSDNNGDGGDELGANLGVLEAMRKLVQVQKYRKPFIILNLLFLLMLFSGNFAISFYAVDIFKKTSNSFNDSKGTMDTGGNYLSTEHLSAIIVATIRLAGALLFIPAVKYFSRKTLICSSSVVMGTSLAVLGIAMYAKHSSFFTLPGWFPLLCVTTYVAVEPLGLGSVPFIYTAEFYPAEMRSFLSGLTIGLSNLELFILIKTFPTLSANIVDGGIFWLYSCVCFGAAVFTAVFVPETRGKALEEIEKYFSRRDSFKSPSGKKKLQEGCLRFTM